ncbi:MAG: NAD(P)H-dependent oxidoreductase [Paraglaciecola sp.]|uniref:NADPH-dependent FMN reductase n=1 Tax=Paraglaciecola sp. TaxID=1920173 RepID=UPI003266CC90
MKILVFLGTVRDSTPPKPARLGVRVANACMECFRIDYSQLDVELIDALDYHLDTVFKPHFAYSKGRAPEQLDELAQKIAKADGFVMISPEYNHTMSPVLANLLNHFGSSLFSYKPSAIVTYSAGQWGGMRAAVGMRTFLAELGCLSVSAMVHVPNAQQVFTEDGAMQVGESQTDWFTYFGRTFKQLTWWAAATQKYREKVDPHTMLKGFNMDPKQRNAP